MFRVLQIFWQRRRMVSAASTRAKAVLVFGLLIWYATSGFLFFELPGKPDLGWLDGLWWAVVTMATVGYGDLFPVSIGGRYLVGVPTMVFGIGFLGYLISEISGTLIESRSRRLRGMEDVKAKDHILIINSPRLETVLKLVRELHADEASKRKTICLVDETPRRAAQRACARWGFSSSRAIRPVRRCSARPTSPRRATSSCS